MTVSADHLASARQSQDAPGLGEEAESKSGTKVRSRLFIKYVALFVAVVGVALLSNGIFEVFFYYREHKASLVRIQQEQAVAAAAKISQFIKEIESQLGWTTQLPWSAGSVEQHRFDALRLLRQVPAITELSQADASGKERLRVSRLAMDVVDSGLDLSADPKFAEAVTHKTYYGPVYFRRESEPYMTLSLAGNRRDAGVSIAEVNLKLIWDVVSQIKVGEGGHAYVVGAQGRLIAHPDISLVLRNTDMSKLPQVMAAQSGGSTPSLQGAKNVQGVEVLTASAPIAPLGWTMFVELPVEEAYASLYQSLERLGVVLFGALVVAVLAGLLLAKRMVGPIRALRAGAARMGSGDFGQRISIKTGDELEGLANQFNEMAARLEESYADLEKKVEDRTIELSESLQRQTATTDVLKVISRSTLETKPDLAPVFENLLASAIRLCGATRGHVYRYDGEYLRYAVSLGAWPGFKDYLQANPLPLDNGSIAGRAASELRVCHIHDVEQDTDYGQRELLTHQAFRSALGVPMLRDGTLLGVIVILKSKVEPFTDKQIDLVTTFADQAVIAIENVRLFDEVQARTTDLQESLQQQIATADVLKVINQSTFDLQPVLDTIVQTASRLCGAEFALIYRLQGDKYHVAAANNAPAEFVRYASEHPLPPGRESMVGRVALERKVVHMHDCLADPEYKVLEYQSAGGYRTSLGVPLLREGVPIGVIVLMRAIVMPFGEKQIELVTTFADQAVIAIENVRLFDEVQARTEDLRESLQQQTATADVLKVISRSAFDLQTVLHTLVKSAAQLSEADSGMITRQEGGHFVRAEAFGLSPELLPMIKGAVVVPDRGSAAGRALLEGKVIHIPDVLADPEYTFSKDMALLNQLRTTLGIPMLREGVPIGVLTLSRSEMRPFNDKQIELVTTFADQAAIAIENSRLFEQVQERTKELSASLDDLRTAQDRLVQTEKLASLGQLTAGIAHEIKNPLNFVNNFAALSIELIGELNDVFKRVETAGKNKTEIDELLEMLKGNLEKVEQHGKRADSIVKNMLLHSREGSGEHRPMDINVIVEESLNLAYHGARAEKSGFNITLQRDLDPKAGMVDLYPQEITRVLLNLISNGFYAASKRKEIAEKGFEPTLSVRTKNLDGAVEIRIRDNGTGIPVEVREKIFNPFFTTKPAGEGTGLGLSMSHDIVVKQHGGKIDVETEPNAFTEFVIVLPRSGSVMDSQGGTS